MVDEKYICPECKWEGIKDDLERIYDDIPGTDNEIEIYGYLCPNCMSPRGVNEIGE